MNITLQELNDALYTAKGHSMLIYHFGAFTFFQKMNENKSTSSKVEFVRSIFGRNVALKESFRICLTFKYLLCTIQGHV